MQYDPSRQGFNNDGNQYPPMNQPPQSGTGNAYPSINAMPPSAQYPQQPPSAAYYGQTPANNSQQVTITTGYQSGTLSFTPITFNLQVFLFISGSLYLIWGILDIALDIALFRTTLNRGTFFMFSGFLGSGYFISGGTFMMVAACKTSYVHLYLLQMFIVTLIYSILGIILTIVSVLLSLETSNLQIGLILVFVISTVHTIVNIIVVTISRNTTIITSTSNVPVNA